MKQMKKIASILLILTVVLTMTVGTAFAQTVDSKKGGSASITIDNASKGETYKVVKLFDASVTGKADGSIVYTGTIPASLTAYFEEVNGYIQAKEAAKAADGLSADAVAAMKAWAEGQTADASAEANGSDLVFTNLPYGYYVITTSQGAAITVSSTNPTATVYDKNSTEPGVTKSVDDADVYIGQTVTYTTTATTSNYLGKGKDSEIVTQYVIEDTLPAFLSDVTVTSITIDGADYKVDGAVPQFDTVTGHTNKAIVIPWATKNADGKYANNYDNGAEIVITYTATVTDKADVDGAGNKNEVILTPYTTPNDTTPPEPWDKQWKDDEIIMTYAAALKKVDENSAPLAGAKFAANGLTVTGSKGNYTVTAYDSTSTAQGTEMETDDNGHLVIKGLPSDVALTVTETVAPAGYNILNAPVSLRPTVINEIVSVTSTKIYYDADGNVTSEVTETSKTVIDYNAALKTAAVQIVNNKGLELPSTGGIGTTIFYVLGAVLVIGAGVLLVTRRRMDKNN